MNPSSTQSDNRNSPASPASNSDAPLRGVFVHRMGENAADERRVAEFWRAHRLTVEAIEDSGDRFSKLPDLRLSYDGTPWAYCEVKTLARHGWKVHILHDGQLPEERVEETGKTVAERIAGDLITAARQLKAGNPDRKLLNFVVLVNRDEDASPGLLSQLLQGRSPVSGRTLKARREARLAEEVQGFRRSVDLCLWVNPAAEDRLVVEACLLSNSALLSFAEEVTGLRGDRLISLDPAA